MRKGYPQELLLSAAINSVIVIYAKLWPRVDLPEALSTIGLLFGYGYVVLFLVKNPFVAF